MISGMNGATFGRAMLIAAGCVLFAGAASAQGTGKNGVFSIHNDTDANTIVSFYTNDGGGWSTN